MSQMTPTHPDIERGAFEFTDFEAFRASLRGWDTDPIQLSAGPLRLTHEFARAPGVDIARIRTNQRSFDTAAIAAGGISFVVTLGRKRWCGLEVSPGSLVLITGGRTHQTVLEAGWESIEFLLPAAQLEEIGLGAGSMRPSELTPEQSVFALPRALVAHIRAWARDVLDPASPTSSRELREEVLHTVLPRLLRHTSLGKSISRSATACHEPPRHRLVVRALQLADTTPGGPLTIEELASPLGVSRRTLELAFRASMGCPPSRYFRIMRLGRVRGNLLRGQSVTEAALEQGFVSLGRFSHLYRRQFSELPSETRTRSLSQDGR